MISREFALYPVETRERHVSPDFTIRHDQVRESVFDDVVKRVSVRRYVNLVLSSESFSSACVIEATRPRSVIIVVVVVVVARTHSRALVVITPRIARLHPHARARTPGSRRPDRGHAWTPRALSRVSHRARRARGPTCVAIVLKFPL